jgi:hypothetical protein
VVNFQLKRMVVEEVKINSDVARVFISGVSEEAKGQII